MQTLKAPNFPVEAIKGILEILDYGQSKGYAPGAWRNEPFMHHLTKAHGHIHYFIEKIDSNEDHLLCALTRLAMSIAVREQTKNNPEEQEDEKL